MKRIIKRLLKLTFLTLAAIILTIVFIILLPQKLFAQRITYKQFTVYSNQEIDAGIKAVLDDATILAGKSELYDPGYSYNIILCNKSIYNKIDGALFGVGRTAGSRLHNVIIMVGIDVKKNLAFTTFHKACTQNLSVVISHEMIHCLQAHKYGIWKFNPFRHPVFWKLEGYPEYISRQRELLDRDYSFSSDIDRYVKLRAKNRDIWISSREGGCEVPDYYYKGKLMIEYLIDVRHFSYDQILKDTTSEDIMYREMIDWRQKKNNE